MIDLELQQQLRALRVAPESAAFDARLHNALLREANLLRVSAPVQTRSLRLWPRRWLWRVAVSFLALSGSATAMWFTGALREQNEAVIPNAAPPPVPATPLGPKRQSPVNRGSTPIEQPLVTPTVPSPPSEQRVPTPQRALVSPATPLGAGRDLEIHPQAEVTLPERAAPAVPERSTEIDRLHIPDNLPPDSRAEAPAIAPGPNARPQLELPDRADGPEARDKPDVAKRREKRNERSRREHRERGLERAREAQQQLNRR